MSEAFGNKESESFGFCPFHILVFVDKTLQTSLDEEDINL